MKNRPKLTAYGLGVGVCCLLLTSTAKAQVGTLDISFGFGSTLNTSSPAADAGTNYGKILTTDVLGNTVAAGVGNFGWTATPATISLQGASFGSSTSTGFFHNEVFGSSNGKIIFESNTEPQTFGTSPLPNPTGKNRGTFHDSTYSAGDLGQDATGVLGFLSTAGNWGYLEFDWVEATSSLTVLSAKIQRFTGQPIIFTPAGSASIVVPEPSSLLLFTIALAMIGRQRRNR